MRFLSDKVLDRLRHAANFPNLEGTRYSLIERVAQGGMGVVYAARDEKLGRRVALKLLDATEPSGELSRRLIQEAQVLARLEHPGIVPVHDVGTLEDGRVFYTMKFIEGQRLDKYVQSVTSTPDRLRLFLHICDTVAFAHARGVLHRDLKPANIMIGTFGEILVLDWGLAKVLREPAHSNRKTDCEALPGRDPATPINGRDTPESSAVTGQGTVLGTPGYMSPEQSRGDNAVLDERSDIFSLGAVLRFLLSQARQPGSQLGGSPDKSLDRSLQAICAKALAPDREVRYSSVTALAEDVSRFLNGVPVAARKETLLDQATRFYRRHNVAILLIAVYLLMRIVLLLISRR